MDKDWLAQAVVREAPEAIVVCDPSGTIVLWNGGAERIFGYQAAEALGENLDLIIPEKRLGAAADRLDQGAFGRATWGDDRQDIG